MHESAPLSSPGDLLGRKSVSHPGNPMDRPAVIFAALAMGAAGAMFYNLLPMILGMAQDGLAITTIQVGLLSAAFFLGYNVLTITAFFWIRRANWRAVTAVATPAAIAALALMGASENFGLMCVSAAFAGGAFSTLYGLAATAIGDTSNPTRWYGVKMSAEAALGAVLFLVLPSTLIASYGFKGLIGGMVLALLVIAPSFYWIPERGSEDKQPSSQASAKPAAPGDSSTAGSSRIWAALASCLLFFGGQTTIWAYAERIGQSAGFEAGAVASLLSVTLVAAVAGSATAAFLGDRWGNILPFVAACLLFLVATVLLAQSGSFAFYAAGTIVVMFSVGSGITFSVAQIASLDSDGRYVVLSVPAIGIGAMLGPGIAGFLADAGGYLPVLIFGATTVVLSVFLALFTSPPRS